jgi:hypothetical protein
MQSHLFLIKQGFEELGLVDDLEVPTKLGIFILQSIITVGTGREDLFDLITLKGLDVLFHEHRVKVLVANPSGRVPATPFFWTENAKGNPYPLEDLHYGHGDLFVSFIKPLKASRKIQPLYFWILGQSFHPEGLGPISPLAFFYSPWITLSFYCPKNFLEFVRESTLHENAAAPHVDDLVKTGNEDRTLL